MSNILFILLFFSSTYLLPSTYSHKFSSIISPLSLGLNKKETLTHLHFYLHDTISGKNQTAFQVAQASITNTSSTVFGSVNVIDDPLTEGPELSSKLVGRAEGMYTSASLTEIGLSVVMNFAFVEGRFNGSTLSVLGRNSVLSDVRELVVVGGSGVFRFARGYALLKTYSIDFTVAVVEYNVYVFHY